MTPQGALRAALSGGDVVAFVPLAWARLPEFLRVARTTAFWLDVSTTQRLLGDAASVCAADACAVPLLPGLRGPDRRPDQERSRRDADDIVTLPEVTAAVRILARLADAGHTGLVAELPTLADLAALITDPEPEDVEDALTDLVRAALEAGAQAIVIRGTVGQDVADAVDSIVPLTDFYGAKALGVDGRRGWAADDCCPVGLLSQAGEWPDLARGVILTAGDVTDWWAPQDMRAVLRERPGAS